jgi:hypothetical protein
LGDKEEKKGLKDSRPRESLPLWHCVLMLRVSSPSNKVMETPGKRGPRLGQITRKPAKRGLLGSQENTTETDFVLDLGLCAVEAQLEKGREKAKQGQTQ